MDASCSEKCGAALVALNLSSPLGVRTEVRGGNRFLSAVTVDRCLCQDGDDCAAVSASTSQGYSAFFQGWKTAVKTAAVVQSQRNCAETISNLDIVRTANHNISCYYLCKVGYVVRGTVCLFGGRISCKATNKIWHHGFVPFLLSFLKPTHSSGQRN